MKSLRFTLLQALCGALVGWVLAICFVDLYSNGRLILMPVNMWEDWLRMESLAGAFGQYRHAGGLLAALAACVSWYAVARRLNPAMPAFPFVKTPAPGLVWTSFLLGGCLFYAGIIDVAAVNSPFYGDFTGCIFNFSASWLNHAQVALFAGLCCALAWLLVSPEGWAGGYAGRARRIFPRALGLLLFLALAVLCLAFFIAAAGKLESSSPHYLLMTIIFLIYLALMALVFLLVYRFVVFLGARWERAVVSSGPEAPENAPRYLRTAVFGLSFGLVLCLGVFLSARMLSFLADLNVIIWTPALEVCYAGMAGMIVLLLVTCMVFWGASVSLAPAFAAGEASMAARFKMAGWPLAFLAAVLAVNGFLYQRAVRSYNWNAGRLAVAAGLNTQSWGAVTLLTLGYKDKKTATLLEDWPVFVPYWSFGVAEGEVSATEENTALLGKFISAGAKSRFLHAAAIVLPDIRAALWQQEEALLAREEAARTFKIVPRIWYLAELSWLSRAAPVTDANHKRLLEFSDPARFKTSGSAALQLSEAWRRFGDGRRSVFWRAEATRLGATDWEIKNHPAAGSAPELTNGTIRGRIVFPKALPGEDILVGLFSSTEEVYPPRKYGFNDKLAASQRLGKGGSFQFAHLSGGGYSISLLVPSRLLRSAGAVKDGTKPALKVSGHPGIMTLSKSRPVIDAGLITIRVD